MSQCNIEPAGMNCSTILIGKNASKTGKVIMSHGEDTSNCVSQTHLVPRMQHEEGEVLTFGDGDAVIPQVKETYAYFWSEFRGPRGVAFSDSFVNEWGVAISSNSCVGSKQSEDEPVHGGIGYGLRRLIAERAKTAREGVEVACALMDQFGYYSSRSYQICDKDEAWVFQMTTGHNYAAQRLGDDEIFYIPNWYTIHNIDFNDTEHKKFYFSKDVVGYPMRHGWYKPAKEGDYSDFDFAEAYQVESAFCASNTERSDLAWKQLTGNDPLSYRRVFSVKADKKYSPEDLKPIMRSHYMGHEEDLKEDPRMSPHRYGICRDTTVESLVVDFGDVPELTCIWRAFPRPCAAPYTPWYLGITKIPEGYEYMGPKNAQASHFAFDPAEQKYNSNYAYWAFHMLQNMMEFDYQSCQERVHSSIAEMEAYWNVSKPMIDQAYMQIKDTNPEYARQLLTDYTSAQAQKIWEWAEDTALALVNDKNSANMSFWRNK